MKWRPNRKVTFSRWKACDVCGHEWPERELRRQKGRLVCPEDYDDKDQSDYRKELELREPSSGRSAPWTPDEEA